MYAVSQNLTYYALVTQNELCKVKEQESERKTNNF